MVGIIHGLHVAEWWVLSMAYMLQSEWWVSSMAYMLQSESWVSSMASQSGVAVRVVGVIHGLHVAEWWVLSMAYM